MTLQMMLDLRVTKLEGHDARPYRAVLLCNGQIERSERFESPTDAMFLLRQFLFPRYSGKWREVPNGKENHPSVHPD